MGVSKIPLREALARLERDGVVQSKANRGFVVRPLNPEELEEVLELRLALEPAAAARGSGLATEQDRRKAARLAAAFEEEVRRWGPDLRPLNREFHLSLVRPGGRPLTTSVIENLMVLGERYLTSVPHDRGRAVKVVEEHRALLAAWCDARADIVAALLREHLSTFIAELRP
jgi:DNA-binding GntR family transcriptional regulator